MIVPFSAAATVRLTVRARDATVFAVSHELYRRASSAVPEEVDVDLRVAEGALPRDLRGVLYRNGPGTNASWGTPYLHPFDGDGHVVRFAFDGARVRYRNRFVATREREEEARLKRPVYRSFGTNLPGGLRKNLFRTTFKNAANTSVVWHGGKLLALWEGGLPHRLDPETLATFGRDDYGGRLRNAGSALDRMLAPELPFSAHPKIDPGTGELFNFGALFGPKPTLLLHRASPAGELDVPVRLPMDRLVSLHDFVLTPRYLVFFLVPVAFRVAPTLIGLVPPADAIEALDGEPTRILLVPRAGGAPRSFEASPCFVFHFAAAHEEPDGRVVVVGLRMPSFPSSAQLRALFDGSGGDFPSAIPTRTTIDPASGRVREERLDDGPAELPTIDPRRVGLRTRFFWSIAGAPRDPDPFLTHVQRFDLDGGRTVRRDFAPDLPGEPVFVPDPDGEEGTGYALVLVYRAREHRSDLFVLRAEDLRTVCRLELPHPVPLGFHGTWVSSPAA